jgi:lauroyl/myristoyl acyltransferase
MKDSRRNVRWFLAYWISRISTRLGSPLPTRFWYRLSEPVADVLYLLLRSRRKVVQQNLRRVVGDVEAGPAGRRVFRNFARYVIDFYQLPSLSKEALRRRIDFDDWQRLNQAMSEGCGGIFVTMHLGQAELGAGALAAYGHPISAIAEPLDYPPMNEFIQDLRRNLGMKVISSRKAKLGVVRCLSRGEVLGMMVDAVEPGEGVVVDFFGARAEFSNAPARIALRTGSRVMPGVVARDPQNPLRLMPLIDFDLHYEPTGDEEEDVRRLTQAIATSLEGYVRRFPDQWFGFRSAWGKHEGEASTSARQKDDGAWKQWALSLAGLLGSSLPHPAAYGLARLAGDAAYRWRHAVREDVEDNMRHVLGPEASQESVSRAAREAFRNVARYYVDLIRLPHLDLNRKLGHDVRLHDFDKLKSRLDAGQGVVTATAHFGNPEMAVQVGAHLGLNILVLAEPLSPPAFAEMMTRLRKRLGARYENVGFTTIATSLRHLRDGGCVAITCDRDIQDKGVPLPFFGVETRLPLGAVELAARTGASLMPAYVRRSGRGFDIHFEEPLPLLDTGRPKEDAIANAKALLARAEEWIRSDPGQWMPLERIWKPLPEPKVRAEIAMVEEVRPASMRALE